jgi:hypothetical protein
MNLMSINKTKTLQILIGDDTSKYHEKYVTLKKWVNNESKDVIAFGENPLKVLQEAKDKGYKSPIMFYVPNPNKTSIYSSRIN